MMQEGQAGVEVEDPDAARSNEVQQSASSTGNASQPSAGREQRVWWTMFARQLQGNSKAEMVMEGSNVVGATNGTVGVIGGAVETASGIDYYQKVLFCRPNYNGFKHL